METTANPSTRRFPGTVYLPARRRWWARIWFDRRSHHLGYYATPEEAHAAYLAAKKAKADARMREAFDRLADAWRAVVESRNPAAGT